MPTYVVGVRALENELKKMRLGLQRPARAKKTALLRGDNQRVLNIETRCVDVLHRPQARGAFAAAFLALQRPHKQSKPSLEVEGADAGRDGRHDARRARSQYHDGAGHR